jgi:hypothetical protein
MNSLPAKSNIKPPTRHVRNSTVKNIVDTMRNRLAAPPYQTRENIGDSGCSKK